MSNFFLVPLTGFLFAIVTIAAAASSCTQAHCLSCPTDPSVCTKCAAFSYLSYGACYDTKDAGINCGGDVQCTSQFCRGDHCCGNSTFAANCTACSKADGRCTSCVANMYVGSDGVCFAKEAFGSRCGANGDCASGTCLGERCCKQALPHCLACGLDGMCSKCSQLYHLNGASGQCELQVPGGYCEEGRQTTCEYGRQCLSNRCCHTDVNSYCTACDAAGACLSCDTRYGFELDNTTKRCIERPPGSFCDESPDYNSLYLGCRGRHCRGGRCCGNSVYGCGKCDERGVCVECRFQDYKLNEERTACEYYTPYSGSGASFGLVALICTIVGSVIFVGLMVCCCVWNLSRTARQTEDMAKYVEDVKAELEKQKMVKSDGGEEAAFFKK